MLSGRFRTAPRASTPRTTTSSRKNDIHRIEGIAQGQACAVKTFGTTGGRHADKVAKAFPGRAFLTQDVFPAPEDLAAIDKGLGLGRQTVENRWASR